MLIYKIFSFCYIRLLQEHLQKRIWEFQFSFSFLSCTLLSCPKNESIQHKITSLNFYVVGEYLVNFESWFLNLKERNELLIDIFFLSFSAHQTNASTQKINNYFTWLVLLSPPLLYTFTNILHHIPTNT